MSLSEDGVACTTTRQKAGKDLKSFSALGSQGGSGVGDLKAPVGMLSAPRIFACGKESFARDSQEVWAWAAEADVERRKIVMRDFFMVCSSTERKEHNTENAEFRAPEKQLRWSSDTEKKKVRREEPHPSQRTRR